MVQKQLKGAANSTLPLPLPVVGGEEKRWHEAPKNIVEGKSKIPSVRQWQWDNCHTAHTDHCDNGVEDELK